MARDARDTNQTSERRVCRLVNLSQNGSCYVKKKANGDEIKRKLSRIAEDQHHCGFRKMTAYLKKRGNA
jgi:hypothetical protein